MINNYFNSVKKKKWSLKNIEERKVTKLIQDLQISDFLARIICSREIDLNNAEDFLKPSLKKYLPSPFTIKDMSLAVDRISNAFIRKEKIAIFGDYDVDGATSSAVLYKSFCQFGIETWSFQECHVDHPANSCSPFLSFLSLLTTVSLLPADHTACRVVRI